jgi:periplasmic protein TonB
VRETPAFQGSAFFLAAIPAAQRAFAVGVLAAVAYRTDVNARDKAGVIIAVVAVHAALLLALLNLSGTIDLGDPQGALSIIDLASPPPPPPPPQQRQQPKPREKEGGSAPKNIRSQATPVVAPKQRIVTPPVQTIVASNTPRQGTAPTQGASEVRGPGTGAGGTGSGTGSGSGGSGSGGGGDNGVAVPPHLATPVLSGRDIPRDLLDRWPRGATVFMRIRVDARGYVEECTVDRGTGEPGIDSALCNIAHARLRFRPALNRGGQAVAGWFGYAQPPPR